MKKIVCAVFSAVILFTACTDGKSVKFVEKNGVWIPDDASVSRFVSELRSVTAAEADAMIDGVFSMADSLGAAGATSETVGRLSDGIWSALLTESATVEDYETVERMLDREALCAVLDPIDYKRIDYRRGLLNLNRPGFAVNDFPVISSDGKECMLRELFTKRTVLFVYGEDCAECRKQMDRIAGSAFIKKIQRDSSLNLVALYSGENLKEFLSASEQLGGGVDGLITGTGTMS